MACGARKKILKVYTMRPVRCVYHAPVLTHTRVNAIFGPPNKCWHECQHGTQECVRHVYYRLVFDADTGRTNSVRTKPTASAAASTWSG